MRVKVRSLRSDLADILRSVHECAVTVVRHGEPIAVIISVDEFEELTELRRVYTSLLKRHTGGVASLQ